MPIEGAGSFWDVSYAAFDVEKDDTYSGRGWVAALVGGSAVV